MKLLFITANRIGDSVLSTGILGLLLDRYPSAEVTVAVGPAASSLFRAVPNVERVIEVRKSPIGLHWPRLWSATANTNWDIIVDLRRSAIAWTLRSKRRYTIPKPEERMHQVRLLAATIGAENNPPSPRLWINKAAELAATKLIPNDRKILALAPAANWKGKQWDAANFSQVAKRLTAGNAILSEAKVAIFAAEKEREQTDLVFQSFPKFRTIDLVGRENLTEVAACLKRCHFFVGNDSGLAHMASAVGIPTLSLFGPSRPELYAPWGSNAGWIQTFETYDELVSAPHYNHRTTESLMSSLTVDAVENAACMLWEKQNRSQNE